MSFRSFSSTSKTFYEILQVPYNSDLKEIKSQYYKLCKILHPDAKRLKSKEESSEFHDLLKAYETLKDPAKRREYDRSLTLIRCKAPEISLKDFQFNSKAADNLRNETFEFWSKIAATKDKRADRKEVELENLNERLEDNRIFKNRIIAIGAILIGYWLSTFRNK